MPRQLAAIQFTAWLPRQSSPDITLPGRNLDLQAADLYQADRVDTGCKSRGSLSLHLAFTTPTDHGTRSAAGNGLPFRFHAASLADHPEESVLQRPMAH